MRRLLVFLSLAALSVGGCQAVVSPAGTSTVHDPQGTVRSLTFSSQWVAARRGGWGWNRGFYGGFGFRPVVATPVVAAPIVTTPIVTTPVVTTTPVFSPVVMPTFAGARGFFW